MTEKKLPPIGVFLIWGQKGAGKTIFGLTSPYKPVLVLDTERSSYVYHTKKLFDFERMDCLDWQAFAGAAKAIPEGKYGTVVVDTIGQAGQWISDYQFKSAGKKGDSQSMMVWGEVRNMIRNLILSLMGKAKILVLTSHARTDYQAARQRQVKYEPRANPAFSELADVSVQLIREPNQRVPHGLIEERDRSMSLPPRVDPCTWEKLLGYLLEQPADWENLKPEEMAPERLYIDSSANAEEIS